MKVAVYDWGRRMGRKIRRRSDKAPHVGGEGVHVPGLILRSFSVGP